MSVLHLFHLPLEWYAVQAPLFTTGGLVTLETVPTLGAAPRPDELDPVAMATGEGIEFLDLPPGAGQDTVPAYSSHIAPTRQSVVTEACKHLKARPLLSVAGVMISEPGAATHRNVARWFSGISITSVFEV